MTSPTTRSFDKPGGRPSPEIADFVSAVRVWLDDLSADEVTELTGGLEADLTDALAEAGSTPAELYGDPAKYANELRAAAGLPPRGAGGAQRAAGPGLAQGIEQNFRETYEHALRNLDAQPWWPGVRDFLVVLRPAWWVIRAWAVVQMLFIVTGNPPGGAVRGGFGGFVLLFGAIVLSVQAGRRAPLPSVGLNRLMALWNVLAILFLLPAMFVSGSPSYNGGDVSYEPSPGLSLDGQPVTNVFPYDSAGRPLTGVQLYDQDGRPLETDENYRTVYEENFSSGVDETEVRMVPGSQAGLAPRWNAFPLQQRRIDSETLELGPVQPAPQPLTGVPPVAASPTLEPTASASSGASPSSAAPKASAATPTPTATSTK